MQKQNKLKQKQVEYNFLKEIPVNVYSVKKYI